MLPQSWPPRPAPFKAGLLCFRLGFWLLLGFRLQEKGAPSSDPSFLPRGQVAAMSRSGQPPDLKKYMDKKLQIKLNANRVVIGTLRGFDQFMNLVVDNTVEVNGNDKTDIGMVVIRGNSVVMIEALEPVAKSQ